MNFASSPRRHQMGRLVIEVEGEDPTLDHIQTELGSLREPKDMQAPHLKFTFGPPNRPPEDAASAGMVTVGHDHLSASHNRYRYSVERVNEVTQIRIQSSLGIWSREPFASLVRIPDPSFLDGPGRLAKTFFYRVFDPWTQVEQLRHGQTWVHASAATNGLATALIVAWGGVGKTSSMLQLLRSGGWQYLADDLALVDESGLVYRSPKHVQVYAYNLAGDASLAERFLAERPSLDRAHWNLSLKLRGPETVRRRIAAADAFGSHAVAEEGLLTHAVFLRKSQGGQVRLRDISYSQLAELASSVLLHELEPLPALSMAAYSTGFAVPIPRLRDLETRSTEILQGALTRRDAKVALVDVPKGTRPAQLGSFLRSYFE
ncbi:MAG TPA: hypothetical protein VIM30_18075 [Candidatus Limnocylindrales bacterium]